MLLPYLLVLITACLFSAEKADLLEDPESLKALRVSKTDGAIPEVFASAPTQYYTRIFYSWTNQSCAGPPLLVQSVIFHCSFALLWFGFDCGRADCASCWQVGLNVCFGPSEGINPYSVWQVAGPISGQYTVSKYGYTSFGCTGTANLVSTVTFSSTSPAKTCSNYGSIVYSTNQSRQAPQIPATILSSDNDGHIHMSLRIWRIHYFRRNFATAGCASNPYYIEQRKMNNCYADLKGSGSGKLVCSGAVVLVVMTTSPVDWPFLTGSAVAEQSYTSSDCLGSPTTTLDTLRTCGALDAVNDEFINPADIYQTRSSPCTGGTVAIDIGNLFGLTSTVLIIIIVVLVVCLCSCFWLVICFCVGGPAALCLLVGISKRPYTPYAPPGLNAGTTSFAMKKYVDEIVDDLMHFGRCPNWEGRACCLMVSP